MITSHLAALRGLVCLALLLTLNAALAYAQLSSAGTFSGLVTDQQGAAGIRCRRAAAGHGNQHHTKNRHQ